MLKRTSIRKGSIHQYKLRALRLSLISLLLSLIIVACTSTSKPHSFLANKSSLESTVLNIWCDKGFTVEEDEALQQLIRNWEKQSGNKIKLSFYADDELPQKTQRAIQASRTPDIMIAANATTELDPLLAWQGKLADVSDVIEPVKNLYPESVLAGIHLYNNIDKKHSYYAIPVDQGSILIFYWRNLLQQIGRSESDIPQDWDGFWEFWKQAQVDLRRQQKKQIYGIGFPLSIGAADTYYLFEQILEAYDVKLLDFNGQLLLDRPEVRQGIIQSLEWYARFYQQGYVPPDAVNWFNPDNNRNLLNRLVLMTPNPTLSIPAAVRQDSDTYRNKLGTLEFPRKPNSKPMRYLVILKEAVLFAESKNQKQAKDFLAYLIQPKIMGDYLKAAGGRRLPVLEPVWQDPFWTDPTDPHISTAAKTLINSQTRLYYSAQNPAYSRVFEEHIWGKALNQIVVNRVSPEQAADRAIERIKIIFDQWQ